VGDQLSLYADSLAYLFARTTGKSKFGLERTVAFLHAIGDPQERLRVIHVAGTNGKGSVCATIEALLRGRGMRVAKYTSPHLVDFRERFVVNGVAIPEEWVVDFIERWTPTVEQLGATFFEATTAMAFAWFDEAKVDAAIIETGLGGRLDSTNVVRPLVAAVTSIGIDHTEHRGDTRELIAHEKAGIFKSGVPATIGEPDHEIRALLAMLAREQGASPVASVWDDAPPREVIVSSDGTRFSIDFDGVSHRVHTPLTGAHQASNAALALLTLRTMGGEWWGGWREVATSMERVRLPGRFTRSGSFIFDVAHNADGARVLATTLSGIAVERPVIAVLCVLSDKDWRGMMDALSTTVDEFVLTDAPTAPTSRAWSLSEAHAYARSRGWPARATHDFDEALFAAERAGGTVLVTGSFHTVGDAMARLQVDPLAG
jgi:dihydrofolate synthase/folylpolyglutamate synthase